MPYADKSKQRAAVNKAVKRIQKQRKAGRPIGSSTYTTPAQVEAAIEKQRDRIKKLEVQKDTYPTKDRDYRNAVSYIASAKSRLARLESQLKKMKKEVTATP
jgi:predicted  nucleic acid-binding Zn-ribbon protein